MKKNISNLKIELIYAVVGIIYIFRLAHFNKILVGSYGTNYLSMLSHNDGEIWWYFGIFLILCLVGGFIVIREVKSLFREGVSELQEILLYAIKIALVIIIIILMIVFINNPILRAIGSAAILGGILVAVSKP